MPPDTYCNVERLSDEFVIGVESFMVSNDLVVCIDPTFKLVDRIPSLAIICKKEVIVERVNGERRAILQCLLARGVR